MDKKELTQKIKTLDGLTDQDRADLLALLNQKRYGLVWEDKPEAIEERLAQELPILQEVPERAIIATPNCTDGACPVSKNPVPNHILIEGDNLEALTTLAYTHAGKIDVIYIDPPYNTGNKDFVYNDKFVDSEDQFRHSKWLSFMEKRLRIARKLLSDKGVIFISIDDNEQAQLKLLCDEILGERNFVANFIWRGGKRNMSKWVSTSHEYMLTYAKNLDYCNNNSIEWRETKKGLDAIYNIANTFIKESNNDFLLASKKMKAWYKSLPDSNPSKDNEHYCWIDKRGVYFASDISRGGGGGPQWDLINPETGEYVKKPTRGWAYSTYEKLLEDVENGNIHFNGNGVPCKKRYLKDYETQILETVFYKDRRGSSKRLRELMGDEVFPFPKDEEILLEKIKAFSNKSSTILDFFAGSGTTLHATMQLNAEDGGNRRCILVTNNENGICENVTYERNRRVIQGYTNAKGEQVAGLTHNNLRYYRTGFVPRNRTAKNMRQLVALATDMLCIKEDNYNEQTEFCGTKTAKNTFRYFCTDDVHIVPNRLLIIYDETEIENIVQLIENDQTAGKINIYVFSPNDDPWRAEFAHVAHKVQLCALPQAIYNAYKNILPQS